MAGVDLALARKVIGDRRICPPAHALAAPVRAGRARSASDGIGASMIVSQDRQESFGRMWRITLKRAGTISSTSVASSPSRRIAPPQRGQRQLSAEAGPSMTASRGRCSGSGRRNGFSRSAATSVGAGKAIGMKAGTGPGSSAPCPAAAKSRHQRNSRLGAIPCRRAASSTIARFSSRDHRRRVSAVITNRSEVSGPDIGTIQVQA